MQVECRFKGKVECRFRPLYALTIDPSPLTRAEACADKIVNCVLPNCGRHAGRQGPCLRMLTMEYKEVLND